MNKTIIEKNKTIAEYMGGVVIADYKGSKGGYFDSEIIMFEKNLSPTNSKYISDNNLLYHKEYNWLIPVVAKVLKVKFQLLSLTWGQADLRQTLSYNIEDIELLFERTYDAIVSINENKEHIR